MALGDIGLERQLNRRLEIAIDDQISQHSQRVFVLDALFHLNRPFKELLRDADVLPANFLLLKDGL